MVSHWEGAAEKLIIQGETGYYFEPGDVHRYTATICTLNIYRVLLERLAEIGQRKANKLFEPSINTSEIELIICNAATMFGRGKMPKKVYGSRLDRRWIPNFITTLCR